MNKTGNREQGTGGRKKKTGSRERKIVIARSRSEAKTTKQSANLVRDCFATLAMTGVSGLWFLGFCCLLLLALAGCGSSSSTPAPGAISVSAQSDFGVTVADAAVFLNDVAKGTTPLEIKDLAPGTYTLKLTSSLYKDYTASVVVQSAVTTTVTATMEAKEAVPDASTVFTKQ